MKQPVVVVDAFTTIPFRGNPAAVCLMDCFPDTAMLQSIAAEMNLSETAFLVRKGGHDYALRWFTPAGEIDLCGHATLAAAHFLREFGTIKTGETVIFHTMSGELRAKINESLIELDFPLMAGNYCPVDEVKGCLSVPIRNAEHNGTNILVEVENMDDLRNCRPHMEEIIKLEAQGLVVTTAGGCGPYDFASRYFAPRVGIPEDPVTGSSHCQLAPYWAAILGKTQFRAFQASGRSGVLHVRVEGERVIIGGQAVTVLRGELDLGESYALNNAA